MLKSAMTMDLPPNPDAGGSVFDFAGAAFAPTADGAGIAAALDLSFFCGGQRHILGLTTLCFAVDKFFDE